MISKLGDSRPLSDPKEMMKSYKDFILWVFLNLRESCFPDPSQKAIVTQPGSWGSGSFGRASVAS